MPSGGDLCDRRASLFTVCVDIKCNFIDIYCGRTYIRKSNYKKVILSMELTFICVIVKKTVILHFSLCLCVYTFTTKSFLLNTFKLFCNFFSFSKFFIFSRLQKYLIQVAKLFLLETTGYLYKILYIT